MLDIKECIEKTKTMKNTSDGGSASYIFGDYVLVCYKIPNQYGIARDQEEEIASEINILADRGVSTPRHVAIHRETIDNINYCWVLQERAKGDCFAKYCDLSDPLNKITKQREVANIPQEHLEKYVQDIIALYYNGLELKPKNFFYDKEHGFTIIDLLSPSNGKTFDSTKLSDINMLFAYLNSLRMCAISPYMNYDEDLKSVSKELDYKIKFKIFNAVKNTIPNFEKHERFILRKEDSETIEAYRSFGYEVPNLKLTDTEEAYFNSLLIKIAINSLEKIRSGKYKLWQIKANEIRIELDENGLKNSWMFHKDNRRSKDEIPEDWDDFNEYSEYDYFSYCGKDLEEKVFNLFVSLLLEDYQKGDNPFVKEAYATLTNNGLKK